MSEALKDDYAIFLYVSFLPVVLLNATTSVEETLSNTGACVSVFSQSFRSESIYRWASKSSRRITSSSSFRIDIVPVQSQPSVRYANHHSLDTCLLRINYYYGTLSDIGWEIEPWTKKENARFEKQIAEKMRYDVYNCSCKGPCSVSFCVTWMIHVSSINQMSNNRSRSNVLVGERNIIYAEKKKKNRVPKLL